MSGFVGQEIGEHLMIKRRRAVQPRGVAVAPLAIRSAVRKGKPARPELEHRPAHANSMHR
jgi:hypothetical protein